MTKILNNSDFENQHPIDSLFALHERTVIDLSIAIETDVASDPEHFRPEIKYLEHGETYG